MIEALKFRHRIALLVALAALALVAVTAMALVLGRRGADQVSGIENRYVPLLELGRELQATFASITRSLEDAASAGEEAGLRDADALRHRFLTRLAAARPTIADSGGDPDRLARSFQAYYRAAREVSSELIAGEAGEQLLAKARAMHVEQQRFAGQLAAGTTPDRAHIAAAFQSARDAYTTGVLVDVVIACVAFGLMLLLSWWIVHGTVSSLRSVSSGVERLARGDFSQEIIVAARDEFGDLAREANQTARRLREYRELATREDWVKTGAAGLAAEIAGELDSTTLGRRALTYLSRYVGAPLGAAYAADDHGLLALLETYAFAIHPEVPASFRPGEGMIGQAARDGELRLVEDLPADYVVVRSALGEAPPRQLLIVPFSYEGRCMGVLEFGFFEAPDRKVLELMLRTRDALAIAFRVAESRQRVQALVDEMQQQAEELRDAYDSLQGQNQALQDSEHELGAQQEQLRTANEELEQQAVALEAQRSAVVAKNQELEEAQRVIEEKASELARASKYKSEFLANMSHELRTPLNSIMILAEILASNEDGRLDPKPVEFAQVIHKSGEELLALINDVLDLAKIEAGKQEMVYGPVTLQDMADYVRRMFGPLAAQKGLLLEVELEGALPEEVQTDRMRLEQILKNLVSNAIKFTERGRVQVRIHRPAESESDLPAGDAIAIAVTDTGEGIPAHRQQVIFEAFAQADGGTSRTHGGTGLGLTIARQLAFRLGGQIRVHSEVGRGSTFTLTLPIQEPRRRPTSTSFPPDARRAPTSPPPLPVILAGDDRAALAPGDSCFLVIEDDRDFAGLLLEVIHGAGFRGLAALGGRDGLELARRFRPSGIILDVGLPDLDGWSVMERLQADRATREIPVHFITAGDDSERASAMGAVGYLSKPVGSDQLRSAIRTLQRGGGSPRVLVVEVGGRAREELGAALAGVGATVEAVASSEEALARLGCGEVGLVVLDLALPDKEGGLALLEKMRADSRLASVPLIVHTSLSLTAAESREIARGTHTLLIVAGERSMNRVLDETRLFVHGIQNQLPGRRRRMIEVVHGREALLEGKRVLIVDDDMRNVYSLSHALQSRRLSIIAAADGVEALEQLDAHTDTDIVLMDIMMPRMDGHEAIRRIREQPRFREMPIIALTAKTMPGDRQKCMEAGASDYIPKPVNVDRLLSLLRVWLSP